MNRIVPSVCAALLLSMSLTACKTTDEAAVDNQTGQSYHENGSDVKLTPPAHGSVTDSNGFIGDEDDMIRQSEASEKNPLQKAGDSAKRTAEKAGDVVSDAVDEAGKTVSRAAEDIHDTVSDIMDQDDSR